MIENQQILAETKVEWTSDEPVSDPLPSEDSIVEEETAIYPEKRTGSRPKYITLIGLLAILLCCGLFAMKHIHNNKAEEIERIKTEGILQCVAGDEEGCHYAMDKLRDANEYDSAEFLKLHLNVSTALTDADEKSHNKYRDNGGANIAEYEDFAKSIVNGAFSLSVQRDDNSKILSKVKCVRKLSQNMEEVMVLAVGTEKGPHRT